MQILDKIDQLTRVLQTLQPIAVDRKNILDKKFRLEFNYNSNHIEGNTLTYGETELLLIFDDTKGNHQFREYEEMKAHDAAYKKIEELALDKERPLMEVEMKNLNRIILVRPFWKDAITSEGQPARREIKIGDYKEMPNSVRFQNGEIFHYASPTDTPIKMQELIDWYRAEEDVLHPVTLAAVLHYNFVRIHPFDDGNGRIARLLLNYVLLRNGLPPVIIKSADKANYLRALNRADIGDKDAFVEYIAEQLIWSLEISIKAAKGESIDEPGDLDKKLAAFKKRMEKKEDEQVEVTYGLKVARNIAESLNPLLEKWENKLKEFDMFFYSRNSDIIITDSETSYTVPRKVNDLPTYYDATLKNYFGVVRGSSESIIRSITIEVVYTNLKAGNNHGSYNGGMFSVYFHDDFYEILIDKRRFKSKLYDDVINEEEILSIVETMGNGLINTIEDELNEG